MYKTKLTIPTKANISAIRVRGRRQWLLINLNATDTRGAGAVTIKTKENAAI